MGASGCMDRDDHLNAFTEATEFSGFEQSLQDTSMDEEDTEENVFEDPINSVLQDTSMIDEEDMEENVFNDPINSVIDWANDGSRYFQQDGEEEDEDSSDEECLPSVCIRMGGELKKAPPIDRLPVIGIGETVHDQPAHEDPRDEPDNQDPMFPRRKHVRSEDDIIGAKASIVYEECLRQLASFLILPVDKCTGVLRTGAMCDCVAPFKISISSKGTATNVEWICPNGHRLWRWNSQPVMKAGVQAGDFLLSTNILLSGSNYTKVALLFKFMNMGMVNKNTFCSIQNNYCVGTVKDFWEERRTEALSRLQGKRVVVLAGGMNDSPGHCAQYCSYTSMENDTKEIIHVATIEKRQPSWKSVVMEKEGFIQTVDKLTSEISLAEICTDAHAQIGALMNPDEGRYKALGIHHSLDMWHGAKNLAKKIAAAAKKEGQPTLWLWLKDVVNHFWWCCKTADGTQQFLELWVGIIHHVCDIHTWAMGRCQHEHMEETRGKMWIQRDSKCHKALVDIVLNKHWLKDIHKYLRFRSTADLEVFQNHILMYASKHYTFSPAVYETRVLLAALDYNFHRNRPTMTTAEGNEIFRRLYKKNGRRYSVYTLKSEKTYGYISELQARIVRRRITSGVGMSRRWNLQPNDPRRFMLPGDVQQVLIGEKKSPDLSPRLDPEPLHIKEEQEELGISLEGEQINGLGEANNSSFPLPGVSVKSENDEDEPWSSQLHQTGDNIKAEPPDSSSATEIKAETDGGECGISEPARTVDPDDDPQTHTDETSSDSSETDVSDGGWQEPLSDSGSETENSDSDSKNTRASKSGVKSWKHEEAPVSDVESNDGNNSFSCLECGNVCPLGKESSDETCEVQQKGHKGEKPFGCDLCRKDFGHQSKLTRHMRNHTGKKPFGCDVCGKTFIELVKVKAHMRVHTGEKPFGCDVCGKRFTEQQNLKAHIRVHTGEKPFGCGVCGKSFNQKTNLKTHMKIHTGEKPFGCDNCGKRFNQQSHLKTHMKIHTGEKPYGCDVCDKRFNQQVHLKLHMNVHSR
ncbi:uncharacterized protein LOC127372967 isoform X2 [Dicentrarchus labrax]|uniref:C2H2-type domain-containing protein n=2 Tax=Dicentrarchus labrax TaxID=13489 RepID=A0A8C4F6N2_DICLA|nr:uncharacterized protein LOC127372967 isoform X2 [Dicentrarchus labrax]XP_051272911.1 uncharacterized protein LOC127372967 isoform X2 [Dicentrarchus labrax]